MPPLGDLAFSVAVVTIIAIVVTIARESVSDDNDTVVESTARALSFCEDTAAVKLEIAIDGDSDRDWLLFQFGKNLINTSQARPGGNFTNLFSCVISASTFCL